MLSKPMQTGVRTCVRASNIFQIAWQVQLACSRTSEGFFKKCQASQPFGGGGSTAVQRGPHRQEVVTHDACQKQQNMC